jgi:hypothetical protein
MGFYSTHQWLNGAVTTVERVSDKEINIRIQDPNEKMLADVVMGEYEALCLVHSITSVLTNPGEDDE